MDKKILSEKLRKNTLNWMNNPKGFKVLQLWEFEINKMTINDFQNKLNEVKI